jgi:multidrug efflux pump subunit AcrA (membrane-fusion protein)
VQITDVEEGAFSMPVVSSGLITTGTESRLSFKTGGIVTSILVEEGESVTKGQLLATLDQTEIDAEVSQWKNNLERPAAILRGWNDCTKTRRQRSNSIRM